MLQLPEPDRKSATPPYRQLAAYLIEQVRSGEYQPGDRLPSVEDIIEAAGVAQMTARKALRVVADAGYGILSPGMGYYVPDELPVQPGGNRP